MIWPVRVGWFAAGAYVAVVAALTTYAFRPSGDGFNVAEGIAAILTVPAIVPALPVIYVVGALAWHTVESDSGDPTLLVTSTFTAMMTVVALANVALARGAWAVIRARRASSA